MMREMCAGVLGEPTGVELPNGAAGFPCRPFATKRDKLLASSGGADLSFAPVASRRRGSVMALETRVTGCGTDARLAQW